jgi:uncharacterized protein YciI
MSHYLLFYDLVPDYLERRQAFREDHLDMARAAHEREELLMAGALAEPADRAVFLFSVHGPSAVEAFARDDPYVRNGLVTSWEVRPWTVVIGGDD